MIPPFFDFINMLAGAALIVYVFIEGICAIGLIRQSLWNQVT